MHPNTAAVMSTVAANLLAGSVLLAITSPRHRTAAGAAAAAAIAALVVARPKLPALPAPARTA